MNSLIVKGAKADSKSMRQIIVITWSDNPQTSTPPPKTFVSQFAPDFRIYQ